MAARKRKATLRKPKKARELISGTPPVPHVVTPKPKPSVLARVKAFFSGKVVNG